MEKPIPSRVIGCERIAGGICSLSIENYLERNPEPGQFMMIWNGENEKPMAATNVTGDCITVTVKVVGPFTRALSRVREGELLGIRGPYGRPFDLSYDRPLLVAGGIGTSPINHLAHRMVDLGKRPSVLLGFNSKEEAIYVEELGKLVETRVCCMDGSMGMSGTAVDNLPSLGEYGCVYTCGPELMMVAVGRRAEMEGVECQLLVERYFKCGIGLCGSCSLGKLVPCTDGPVFRWNQLKDTEFGDFRRDRCGLRVDLS